MTMRPSDKRAAIPLLAHNLRARWLWGSAGREGMPKDHPRLSVLHG